MKNEDYESLKKYVEFFSSRGAEAGLPKQHELLIAQLLLAILNEVRRAR